jgi:hypothetical protein
MAALRSALAALAVAAACGAPGVHPARHQAAPGDDITLYRDVAYIRQRARLELPATPTTVKVELPRGVSPDQITILDRGGVQILGVHAKSDSKVDSEAQDDEATDEPTDELEPSVEAPADYQVDDDGSEVSTDDEGGTAEPTPSKSGGKPTELRLDVQAPRAGTYAITIGYVTDRLAWDVAYTMVASSARDRGELSGALAIRNETGITLRATSARVVDAELIAWRKKSAEHVAATLVGGTHGSTLPAVPRELGAVVLGDGETRVELAGSASRKIHSVLVYDAIGRKLDNIGPSPLREPELGATGASTRVSESFEVVRDPRVTAGLPGGPVRLLERRSDSSLGVLGESRLFDAATRVSHVDTIDVGTAQDVSGSRERREFTVDEEGHRLVEEFAITLDNKRAHPVEVLVREHLYRGQNWVLAYQSAPEASKEGAQQISLRTKVPARSKVKIVYVVVYTWSP